MPKLARTTVGLLLLPWIVLLAKPVQAGLELGDPAPALSVTEWIKGTAVDLAAAKGKKVLVVEFWATWCGPCIASMPHLSELQRKYSKEVTFIGVTKPDARNPLDRVKTFVAGKGETMDYTVAFDGAGETFAAYMKAAGKTGIPAAFIVDKEARVAWMGHPGRIDQPLAQIVAGTYDIEKERQALLALKRVQKLRSRFQSALRVGRGEIAGAAAEELVAAAQDDVTQLNFVAWTLLTNKAIAGSKDALALEAAWRASDLALGKNWMVLDTLALAEFKNGALREAVATLTKAIELAKAAGVKEKAIGELNGRLQRFQGALSSEAAPAAGDG